MHVDLSPSLCVPSRLRFYTYFVYTLFIALALHLDVGARRSYKIYRCKKRPDLIRPPPEKITNTTLVLFSFTPAIFFHIGFEEDIYHPLRELQGLTHLEKKKDQFRRIPARVTSRGVRFCELKNYPRLSLLTLGSLASSMEGSNPSSRTMSPNTDAILLICRSAAVRK